MKVALLLNGFVRDNNNLSIIQKFLEVNNDYGIDLYTSTYNIIGIPSKFDLKSKNVYENSKLVTEKFLKDKLSFREILIEDFEEVQNQCDEFAINHKNLYSEKISNNKFIISNIFSQWRNLYKTYSLIDNPSEYDLIIRYRYDLDGKNLRLSEYFNLEENKIFLKSEKSNKKVLYKNGLTSTLCRDGCVIGSAEAMKKVCGIGKYENYSQLMSDPNNSLVDKGSSYFVTVGKPSYYSNESNLLYWCLKNNLKISFINENHLSGTTLTRAPSNKIYMG